MTPHLQQSTELREKGQGWGSRHSHNSRSDSGFYGPAKKVDGIPDDWAVRVHGSTLQQKGLGSLGWDRWPGTECASHVRGLCCSWRFCSRTSSQDSVLRSCSSIRLIRKLWLDGYTSYFSQVNLLIRKNILPFAWAFLCFFPMSQISRFQCHDCLGIERVVKAQNRFPDSLQMGPKDKNVTPLLSSWKKTGKSICFRPFVGASHVTPFHFLLSTMVNYHFCRHPLGELFLELFPSTGSKQIQEMLAGSVNVPKPLRQAV